MHGPPVRDDGPAVPAALAVGDGVEGRRCVDDDEGDEKCISIFGVVVVVVISGGAIAVVGAGGGAVSIAVGTDIEKAHPNALEASAGLAARSRPVSSKIIGR